MNFNDFMRGTEDHANKDLKASRKSVGRHLKSESSKSKMKKMAGKVKDTRNKKERYENMLRIGKEGADHFQK